MQWVAGGDSWERRRRNQRRAMVTESVLELSGVVMLFFRVALKVGREAMSRAGGFVDRAEGVEESSSGDRAGDSSGACKFRRLARPSSRLFFLI